MIGIEMIKKFVVLIIDLVMKIISFGQIMIKIKKF
jgi:hypothetical protein